MLSTDQLMVFLADSGIVSTQRLRVFQEHLRRRKHEVESIDALMQELVQAGLITGFQAEEIEHGQGERLVFGSYVLIDRIGRGGMGEVFRARHTLMHRDVAIKFLGMSAVDKIGSVRRFQQEVRAAAKLIHPNIVTALDAGERDGICYLVMELVPGATLLQHVCRGGPLPVSQTLDFMLQVAEALAYAHSRGIVHRDVKPGNLILTDQGTVKLLDLGLSRLRTVPDGPPPQSETAATEQHLTGFGNFMGTVDFMSPEQATDPHDADQRADIYSLGCTLYFLLTGQPPFPGKSVVDRLIAHRDGEIPSLQDKRPETPPRLETLLQAMLAKSANQRVQCMEDVIVQLKECRREFSDPSTEVPVTMLLPPGSTNVPGRGWRGHAIVASGVLLAAMIGLLAWWRPWESQKPVVDPPGVERVASRPLTEPVDLLQHIDVQRDRLNGEDWKLEDGRLVTADDRASVLTLNHSLTDEYSLEIGGHRLTGTGPLVVGLVLGEHECYALLDAGRPEGSQFAIGTNADGRLVRRRYREPLFEPGQPFQVRCVVRATTPARIEVTSNGEALVEWSGDPADLELGAGWSGVPGQLFLGTNDESSFSIDQLVLAPLTERSLDDAGSDADIPPSTASPVRN